MNNNNAAIVTFGISYSFEHIYWQHI